MVRVSIGPRIFSMPTQGAAGRSGHPTSRRLQLGPKRFTNFSRSTTGPQTEAKYRPSKHVEPAKVAPSDVTLGQYLAAVHEKCHFGNPRTLTGYENCLRRIAADIHKIDDKGGRYDHLGGKRDAWLAKVHEVKLSSLTSDALNGWQVAYLKAAKPDPLSQRRRKISCATFLRQAKSLFSPKILDAVRSSVAIPDPVPFTRLTKIPRQSMKYSSTVDLAALFAAAHAELLDTQPELYKVFLLGVTAGLRRKEIDLLPWSAFDWKAGTITLTPTLHFEAKSEDSYGIIAIEPAIMEIFRQYHKQATTEFVIESSREVKTVRWNFYRCELIFDGLTAWLRSKGITGNKPLHTLRKEFGSAICSAHGIYAASRALRHADLAITSQHYVESRSQVTAGMSHLLPPAPQVVS
jgi:integrase